MNWALGGKTVFITGATGGIGSAVSRELIGRGANVVVTDMAGAPIDDLVADLGERAMPAVVDVTDRGSIDRAVAAAVDHFGGIDIVFANAGIANTPPQTVASLTDEKALKVIDVDLNGVWHTVRATLPQVIDSKGYVLLTASIYAFMNGAVNTPYAMSKAAVEQLGRGLRAELAYRGASAGVLYPGWIDTDIARVAMRDEGPIREMAKEAFKGPLGKLISPEKLAKFVANGMEKRAPRIIAPRRWIPLSLGRGVFNVATDAYLERNAKINGIIEQIDRDAQTN